MDEIKVPGALAVKKAFAKTVADDPELVWFMNTKDLPLKEFRLTLLQEKGGEQSMDIRIYSFNEEPEGTFRNLIEMRLAKCPDTYLAVWFDKTLSSSWVLFHKQDSDQLEKVPSRMSEKEKSIHSSNALIAACAIAHTFTLMLHQEIVYEQINEIRPKCESQNEKTTSLEKQHKQIIRLQDGVRVIRTYLPENTNTKRQYHVGEFSVRGHYRHYRNGKVIFINPYKKRVGKSLSEKVYKVL